MKLTKEDYQKMRDCLKQLEQAANDFMLGLNISDNYFWETELTSYSKFGSVHTYIGVASDLRTKLRERGMLFIDCDSCTRGFHSSEDLKCDIPSYLAEIEMMVKKFVEENDKVFKEANIQAEEGK